MISLRLPDGSTKQVPEGTRPRSVAVSIGKRLAQAAVVAKVNGIVYDLDRELPPGNGEVAFQILTEKDPEPLESRSATNAGKPRRDAYFENLIELWCEIGGARENKKPLQAFVQVASAPFIGPTRAETICKILRRLLEKRGASTLR